MKGLKCNTRGGEVDSELGQYPVVAVACLSEKRHSPPHPERQERQGSCLTLDVNTAIAAANNNVSLISVILYNLITKFAIDQVLPTSHPSQNDLVQLQ